MKILETQGTLYTETGRKIMDAQEVDLTTGYEEVGREMTRITVHYSDGANKEIMHGCCVDLTETEEEITVDMLNITPVDIVRLAYGMLVCVDRMGLMDSFRKFAGGGENGKE